MSPKDHLEAGTTAASVTPEQQRVAPLDRNIGSFFAERWFGSMASLTFVGSAIVASYLSKKPCNTLFKLVFLIQN